MALPNITIANYSEKSLVVTGDTKPIKDALKSLGGKFNSHLSCGAGWIFPCNCVDALYELQTEGEVSTCTLALLNVEKAAKAAKSDKSTDKAKASGQDYKKNLQEYLEKTDNAYAKSNPQNFVGAVKLGEYYFPIIKPSIGTRFAFHDFGKDKELYTKLQNDPEELAKYFVNENIREKFQDYVLDLNAPFRDSTAHVYIRNGIHYDSVRVEFRSGHAAQDGEYEITDEERSVLLDGISYGCDCFEKRLNTYIKRYGVSKIRIWEFDPYD